MIEVVGMESLTSIAYYALSRLLFSSWNLSKYHGVIQDEETQYWFRLYWIALYFLLGLTSIC